MGVDARAEDTAGGNNAWTWCAPVFTRARCMRMRSAVLRNSAADIRFARGRITVPGLSVFGGASPQRCAKRTLLPLPSLRARAAVALPAASVYAGTNACCAASLAAEDAFDRRQFLKTQLWRIFAGGCGAGLPAMLPAGASATVSPGAAYQGAGGRTLAASLLLAAGIASPLPLLVPQARVACAIELRLRAAWFRAVVENMAASIPNIGVPRTLFARPPCWRALLLAQMRNSASSIFVSPVYLCV